MYKISTYRIDPRPIREELERLSSRLDGGERRMALYAELKEAQVGGSSLNTTEKFLSVENALHFAGLVLKHARSEGLRAMFEGASDRVWVEVERWHRELERDTQEFEIPTA